MPCSVVEVYGRFEGTSCHRIHVGTFTPNYTAPITENYNSKLVICAVEFELPASRMRLAEICDPEHQAQRKDGAGVTLSL
jgi:hypothetical protein